MKKTHVNIPESIGNDAADLVRMILDCEVKIFVYPDCTHPQEFWQCDNCDDHARDCNCFGCNVICGNCSETLVDVNGKMLSCDAIHNDTKTMTFKQMMAKRRSDLITMLAKDLKNKNASVTIERKKLADLDMMDKAIFFDRIVDNAMQFHPVKITDQHDATLFTSLIINSYSNAMKMYDLLQTSCDKIMPMHVIIGEQMPVILEMLLADLVKKGYKMEDDRGS